MIRGAVYRVDLGAARGHEQGGRRYGVVNVNAIEGLDTSRIRRASASFDGEDVDARLARRVRNWIPDVRFVDKACA